VRRGQAIAATLVLVLVVGGAAYADREVAPRAFGPGADGPASSGMWMCPHGGGPEGWEVFLQIANPGDSVATIRVTSLGADRPSEPETLDVGPGEFVRVPVDAEGRGRTSAVEWFGGWVAVGWLAHAGGGEGGVAVEPCTPAAGSTWLLPDGTTEVEDDHDFVVVMNPFSRQAVFSLALLSERQEPVRHSDLTDVVLKPFRSAAFNLNDVVLGERTVSTLLEVSVGRVAAATLGVSGAGGIRAALGYLGEASSPFTFPGGEDAGRTELAVMNVAAEEADAGRVTLAGGIVGADGEVPFAGLADTSMPSGSARTFPATTTGTTSIRLVPSGPGVAAVRRTFGVASDQAAVTAGVPAPSWIVLPAVAGSPNAPGLVLSNPGTDPAVVTLRFLSPGPADEVTVTVAPGTTVQAPQAFVRSGPEGAVLATASSGTFIAASASYSLGAEGVAAYAVALGIPIPMDPS
jgi:hypothetical protein